ncbi:MAG: O-antigen ligase family protein [Deltaproteobacteria bacterium]|nr:O-antigen ligase family protein [Deltaproteobacteria bacterium]
MAFFFLNVFTFIMFFQPVSVFPALAPYRPYRYSAIIALISFLLAGKKSDIPLLSVPNVRYFLLFATMQVISSSAIWLHGGIDTFKNIWLNLIIIYVIIVMSCTDEKKIKSIILMVVAAIFYLSYKSVSDVIINYHPGLRPQGFGWYENPNDLALILTCTIPLAFCLWELSTSIIIKLFFIGVNSLFAVNMLLSASRGALLGLMAVGCMCLLFIKNVSKFIRLSILALLIVSIGTFGIATVFTRSDLIPGQLTGDDSSENRIVQWKACLRMVKAHPFLGVGPGESVYEMRNYGGIRGLVPHNTLIQAFAETGIPGGIFFMMCTIFPIWEAWTFFKLNRGNMSIPSVIIYKYLIISLSGFWICALLSNRIYFSILYVTIALITAIRENVFKPQGLIAES